MNTPLIETALTTATTVAVNNSVPLGGIVRRRTNCFEATGSLLNIQGSGMYEVTVDLTFNSATVGDVSFQLQQDGVNVLGATLTETISVASTQIKSSSFTRIIKVPKCGSSTISVLTNGAVAPTVTNMVVTVRKV